MSLISDLSRLSDETSSERRRKLLRSVTDLFLSNANYAKQQLDMFDEILTMVADSVSVDVRAEFADRIADRADAPSALIERLATDDASVAAPVLQRSPVLTDDRLAAIAECGSQAHMLAISGRKLLSEIITDVLVRRGDSQVVRCVAGNEGARFSVNGFGELVRKAEGDHELQMRLVIRRDLPPETVERLLPHLSEQLMLKLADAGYASDGRLPPHVLEVVRDRLGEAIRRKDREMRDLDVTIAAMQNGGVQLQEVLRDLAAGDRVHDMAYVLARVAGLDAAIVGSALFNPSHEPIVLIARSLFLNWQTFSDISAMRRRRLGEAYSDDAGLERGYHNLSPAAAQRSMRFLKLSTKLSADAA